MGRETLITGFDETSRLNIHGESKEELGVEISQTFSDQPPSILERILSASTSRGITHTSGPTSR